MNQLESRKLGEILIERGLLQTSQLENALAIQTQDKSILGKILLGENYLRSFDLHQAVAEKYGIEFVNLMQTILNFDVLKDGKCDEYFTHQVLPYAEGEGYVTLAVTEINEAVKDWAIENYPHKEIKFVITSPKDIRYVLQQRFGAYHDDEARLKLWRQDPHYSALKLFDNRQSLIPSVLLIAFCSLFTFEKGFIAALTIMNLLFFLAMTFKDVVFVIGQKAKPKAPKENSELPIYSILLPLHRENETLPKLIRAIERLDYPKSKLDVKFVVEADDRVTISALKKLTPPSYMEIITVPYSLPQTKPKACNYALNFVRGEYVTIYDAEDIPNVSQLKDVLNEFAAGDENLACVQARLNYYNYHDNQLTRWFGLEYAVWFDSVMVGLSRLKMPIPLGGTSNHVKTSVLKKIGGWDAFNVTEDADLGMRLAQEGYRTSTISSLTLEEAPNELPAWVKQRTRWLKGFMQTYFVHMRRSRQLIKKAGWSGFLSLQFFIGIPVLIYLTAPILLIVTALFTMGSSPIYVIPHWLTKVCAFNLLYGIASHIIMCIIAAYKAPYDSTQKLFKHNLIFSSLTFQFYGLLHIVAAFRAIYQLFTAPHYWDKTEHGKARTGIVGV